MIAPMLFFALLAVLFIEQLLPLEADNWVHAWARRWVMYTRSKVVAANVWLARTWWAAAVIGPALLSVVVYQILLGMAWPLAWLWLVGVLYVTLGFRQFSHYFSTIREALQAGREDQALTALAQWSQVDDAEARRPDWVARVLSLALLAAQRHVLGVWLAFVVLGLLGLGPAGAVLYRMAEYTSRLWRARADEQTVWANDAEPTQDASAEAAVQRSVIASQAWHWVDWLPVRISALGFAAAGHFEGVVTAWRDAKDSGQTTNDSLLLAAGAGALHVTLQDSDQPTAQDADEADLAVMSASLLDEHAGYMDVGLVAASYVDANFVGASSDDAQSATHTSAQVDVPEPAVAPKPRHVAALASFVWRVVVFGMTILAAMTLASWLS